MANTTTKFGLTAEVTGLDANWDHSAFSDAQKKKSVASVVFTPSAAADKMVIHNGSTTGPRLILLSDAGQQIRFDFPEDFGFSPYVVISECTLGTAANAAVLFVFHP